MTKNNKMERKKSRDFTHLDFCSGGGNSHFLLGVRVGQIVIVSSSKKRDCTRLFNIRVCINA